ncbi:MAG: transposase [Firmicutes bacterium]|nr:transposase [Bacillota bacterium]
MGKIKFTPEDKVKIIQAFQSGEVPYSMLNETYGMNPNEIYRWIKRYEFQGINAFSRRTGNSNYTQGFKIQCVEEYLRGEGSHAQIAAKYNIPSTAILRSWIKCYNANKELKDYDPKREVYMADARRKTTLEERKEIAEYCITHEKDYTETAALYEVSYSQVYTWVKKYLSQGEEGLADRRGHHKTDDEVDELERLRRENLRLKRQLEDERRTIELLKKVEEFERM